MSAPPPEADPAPVALAPLSAPAPLACAPVAGTCVAAAGVVAIGGLWAQAPSAITATSNIRFRLLRIVLSINFRILVSRGLGPHKGRPHRLAHFGRIGAQAL